MTEQISELAQLWEQAVDEYLRKSKRGSVVQRWKRPITTQADLDNLIQQHESDFAGFRNSRRKFWDVLIVTMGQLQNLGKIAQAAIQLSPFAPTAVVIEAGLFLISSGSAVASTYDALETLFGRVRDITDRVDEYLKGNVDQKLHKVVIRLLSSVLDVFGEGEAAIKRGRGKEMMRRVVGKENHIQSALDRLDEWVQTEIALITAKTHAITQRIEVKADNERDRGLLRRALCAEAAADNEAFGKNIEISRLSPSGDWVLKEQLYDKWVKMEIPVLWILGKPGTGKTYLASRILSHIRQKSEIASCFYIREGNNTQHTPEVILKVIAYQITQLHETYRERAVGVCKDGASLQHPEPTWENLFVKPFSDEVTKPVFAIIDGVDEATPHNQKLVVEIAKKLSDLRFTTRKYPAIQLLLLGRPDLEYNVSNAWQGEKRRPKILHVQPSLSKSDVERFVKKGVKEGVWLLRKMHPGPSERLRRDIVKSLVDSSDGMFMLAKLMLAEIKDMNKPELIQESLAKPPLGLDDMFRRVVTTLDVMGGFDKKDLNELIMWVACAKRDLLLGELDLVLKLRDLRQNGIVGLEDELKTRFGSFFSIMSTEAEMESEDEEDEDEDVASIVGSETTLAKSVSGESSGPEDEFDTYSQHGADLDGNESDRDEDENENDDDIPSNYFTTTVKFGHASVGQHFRTAPLHRGIGMDLNFTQAHIALTCIRFLTNNIPKKKQKPWREPDLFEYSVDHFLDHFGEVDFEELKSSHPDIFNSLSEEVLFLFRDRDSIRRWFHALSNDYKFMCQLFSQTTCSRLRSCIAESDIRGKETTTSPGEEPLKHRPFLELLLEPFAHYVVEAWLVQDSCEKMLAILFLQGFLSLRDGQTHEQWTSPPNRPFENIVERISPEEIWEMASLGGMERDAAFHSSLGSTFAKIRTSQHLLAAVGEFEQAIKLTEDPEQLWLAKLNKADVLSTLGKFEDAIEAASSALKVLPESRFYIKRQLIRLISGANLHLGNGDAALEAAVKEWESAPNDPVVGFNLIFTAHRAGDYSETVGIIRSALDSANGARYLGNIITTMTPQRYTTEYLSIACKKVGDLDLARDAFQAVKSEAAVRSAKKTMAAADAALAQLFFGFYQDDDKAIALWEDIVRDYPSTTSAIEASFALMPLYFSNAQNADPTEACPWVLKMEQLVDLIEPMRLYSNVSSTQHEAAVLLGRWYADQNQLEQARAKIRPLIKQSIRELTDRDNSNDYSAYSNLARALLCFGHRQHAAIALAFTTPLQGAQEIKEGLQDNADWDMTTAPVLEANTATTIPLGFSGGRCDGGCDRREATFKSFSLCEICVNVGFCDECHRKLIDGTAIFRICNPKHPLIEIYPSRGLVTKGAEGYRVHLNEGKVVSAGEWLGMISQKWLGS
ncbi:hypothetical protein V497_03119 [Pseudogymnoascus sp. VKM F-4516 (FW-969)]|nr:hypothetical protein V497_03119 [Pseudogymnoascus sp. VKM F-4516 (FW-969)]